MLTPNDKEVFKDTIDTCHGGKSKLRGSHDYLIYITYAYNSFSKISNNNLLKLLYTSTEISRLLKSPERTPRFFFKHALLCFQFPFPDKNYSREIVWNLLSFNDNTSARNVKDNCKQFI